MKEIIDKISAGFEPKAEVTIEGRAIDITPDMRVESLKLAYDFAASRMSDRKWQALTLDEQINALREIFDLANYNAQYILTGKVDI